MPGPRHRVSGRGFLKRRALRLRSVGQVDHTILVRLTRGERQLAGRGFLGEEPRAGPAGKRVDEEMQLVDQAIGEHRSHQRAAAGRRRWRRRNADPGCLAGQTIAQYIAGGNAGGDVDEDDGGGPTDGDGCL